MNVDEICSESVLCRSNSFQVSLLSLGLLFDTYVVLRTTWTRDDTEKEKKREREMGTYSNEKVVCRLADFCCFISRQNYNECSWTHTQKYYILRHIQQIMHSSLYQVK